MLIFSVVVFVFLTLTLFPRPPLPLKVGGHDPPAPMGAPPLDPDRPDDRLNLTKPLAGHRNSSPARRGLLLRRIRRFTARRYA